MKVKKLREGCEDLKFITSPLYILLSRWIKERENKDLQNQQE